MSRRATLGSLAACPVVIFLSACGPEGAEGDTSAAAANASLYVDPGDFDFSSNPDLLERLRTDPHGYFRFINIPFSQRICELYADRIGAASSEQARAFQLNLHGDAHIEQYAVTDLGRGLTDFDDSSQGPPFLDLLRFAVSMRLASRMNGWDELTEEGLVRTFLNGYRSALENPSIEAPEPTVVTSVRATFRQDTTGYLKWVESQMERVSPDVEAELVEVMAEFADVMASEHPEVQARYFSLVSTGYLKLGVGSALDTKFLARMQGPSEDPLDDVVLEVKQVRDLEGIECVQTTDDDPFRIMLGQARISYEPFKWLGYVRIGDRNFWTHEWVQNYVEVDVDQTFSAPGQLAEIANDAGVQLGIGHPKLAAAPFDQILRRQTLEHLRQHPREIPEVSAELADEVEEAWRRFAAATEGSSRS